MIGTGEPHHLGMLCLVHEGAVDPVQQRAAAAAAASLARGAVDPRRYITSSNKSYIAT